MTDCAPAPVDLVVGRIFQALTFQVILMIRRLWVSRS